MLEVKQYDQEMANAATKVEFIDTDYGFVTHFGPEVVDEMVEVKLKHQGKILMALVVGILAVTYVCAYHLWAIYLAIYAVAGNEIISPEFALRAANCYDVIARIIWGVGGFFVGTLGYLVLRIKQLRLAAVIALVSNIIVPNVLIVVTQIVMDRFGFRQMIQPETWVLRVGLIAMVFIMVQYVVWVAKVASWRSGQGGSK